MPAEAGGTGIAIHAQFATCGRFETRHPVSSRIYDSVTGKQRQIADKKPESEVSAEDPGG